MNSITVYLAGAMTYHAINKEYEKATEWRKYAKDRFEDVEINVFDPTDHSLEHFEYPENFYDGITIQNNYYLQKCDILLVNLSYFETSLGSIFEVFTMWKDRKPIVAFGSCIQWQSRPHFRSMIPVILETVEDACDYIISMYNQKI